MSAKQPTGVQQYLDDNQVSAVLEEVCNQLVVDKPADPVAYLADLLAKKVSSFHHKRARRDCREIALMERGEIEISGRRGAPW